MKNAFKSSLIVFSFTFLLAGYSQQKSIKFDTYSIENGLSQSSVTGVVQDDFGFVWIATQDGLNRFDGYHFQVFKNDPNDSTTIPNNYIHTLIKDPQGMLWFGTNRGIAKLNPATNEIERINRENFPDLRGYMFSQLVFDQKGALWALSDKHGINRINLVNRTVEIIPSIDSKQNFSTIFIDENNFVWVGTHQGDIYYSDTPFERFNRVSQKGIRIGVQINQFYPSSKGSILVASETGIFRVTSSKKLQVLTENKRIRYSRINCVYEENNHNIWAGSAENGLFLIKQLSDKQIVYNYNKNPYDNSSITGEIVQTIMEDQNGIFWIGTDKGVSKFDKYKQGFTTISLNNNPDNGLIDYNVWSFAEDSANNIYIGTQKDLTIYRNKDQIFYHIKRPDGAQHFLLSIYVENQNKIWLGYEDGLFILHIENLQKGLYHFQPAHIEKQNGSKDIRVYQIVPADKDRLWIGSRSGLSIINKTSLDYEFYGNTQNENSIGEGSVKVVYRDLSGKIWLVTSTHGLYNIVEKPDGSFYFKHYPIINHTEKNSHITCILQTDKQYLWLGTYGEGMKKLDLNTNKTTNYSETDGLSNNVVYGLLSDDDDNVWASTNKGISKFNPKTEKFTTYNVNDGLQSNEFNTNAYFKSSSGQLYFGGINGFNIFDPTEISINPNPPLVLISQVILSTKGTKQKEVILKNISSQDTIELEYYENDLSFEFVSTHYSNVDKTRFKYILEGQEEDYTYLENENKVHYMNIPHGEYTLKVYAQSSDGIWSLKPTTISLIITPPIWLTWWFRIIVVLLLTLAGFLIYRRRVDKIRRQKVRLEIEVVKRTRQVTEQSKKIQDQKQKVEIQKAKIEHQKSLLETEKEKVEQLLLNVLPEGTAEELKSKGRSKARYYKNVSVLFTDFVGFSKIAEEMKPQELVQQLDGYFSKFDEIIEKYDLEKIKTIGDSYMCAGGVPIRNKSNSIEVTLAALEIKDFMLDKASNEGPDSEETWNIRIGINTGEVIAGVIGLKRFAYDIWGATVNQAQRMEMHGQPGTVNVSGNTYEYIAPYFNCTYRGKIQTKHKGMLDMFYVKGIKQELSLNGEGKKPNSKFWKIVDLHLYSSINYMKAERHIMQILEKELSPKLLYHSINHTIDVTKAVERIAIMEGITDEDLFLLKSAATYHDAGFIESYDNNEEIGMRLAREILPKYGYTQEQIDIIDGLIKSTEIPQSPNTHLEQIMCDADLDYLGRDDFHDIASLLRRELREHGKLDSDKKWDEIQIGFLEQHTYFTKSAIKLRQVKKLKHLKEIEDKLINYKYKD